MPERKLEALALGELRSLIQQGIESGPALDVWPVFSRLESKYAAMRKPK